jgi:L-ascorbate metabolism protein UlaG (beta-lactamase superfamily)
VLHPAGPLSVVLVFSSLILGMISLVNSMNRRRFLTSVGLTGAATSTALASDTDLRRTRWEMIAHDGPMIPASLRPRPERWDPGTITVSWLGHATVLLNFFGMRIITDPVFSERIGVDMGLFTLGPRRLVAPALSAEELGPIDLILLSHAHMDHLDIPTLRGFDRSTPVVIAQNTYDVIQDLDFSTVYELDWGKWTAVGDLRIEALEVKHFGWRFPWERDRSRGYLDGRSYNAYLLSKNGSHIVFGGDTAYQEHFAALGSRLPSVELAIMPIGAYDPWIHAHANPEQALAMADQMGAYHVLPIHWNTFIQSQEPTSEPITRLKRAAGERPDRIVLETIGQTWTAA